MRSAWHSDAYDTFGHGWLPVQMDIVAQYEPSRVKGLANDSQTTIYIWRVVYVRLQDYDLADG